MTAYERQRITGSANDSKPELAGQWKERAVFRIAVESRDTNDGRLVWCTHAITRSTTAIRSGRACQMNR